MNFKRVTMEEFQSFIRSYPNKLERDVCAIGQPPVETYNDFTTGKVWPESVVAKIVREWTGANGEMDENNPGAYWEYYIPS